MKIKSNILTAALILLCGYRAQLEAQTQTAATGLQANEQDALLNNNRFSYLFASPNFM